MANRLSRTLIMAGLSRNCHGSTRLASALTAYAGLNHSSAISDHVYAVMVRAVLDIGAKAFGVDPDALRGFLRDPVTRRGATSVLTGIALYGITKPQLLNAPFLVVWNLTNMCNLRCKHCYQRGGLSAPDELTLGEKIRVVNELADAGVVSVAFSGGEPLMHPDFFPVVREARRRGMHVAVATNGTLITRETARRLKEADVGYVEVSLDSIHPEVNDEFRGVSGAWKRAVKGIENCVQEEIYTAMATTVTKINLADVPKLIDLAKSLGVKRFMHFNFIPTGRGREIAELDLSPAEREELLKLLYEKSRTSGIEVLSTAPQYARVVLQQSAGSAVAPTHFYVSAGQNWGISILAEFIGGCGSGRLYCAVQPNGDVTPCVFIPQLVVGNLRKEPFSEIWRNLETFKCFQNRDVIKGACKVCKYKYVCGGCRARALSYFGDLTAPDVGCIYNQKAWMDSACARRKG